MKLQKSPYDKISKLNRLNNSFLDDFSRNPVLGSVWISQCLIDSKMELHR